MSEKGPPPSRPAKYLAPPLEWLGRTLTAEDHSHTQYHLEGTRRIRGQQESLSLQRIQGRFWFPVWRPQMLFFEPEEES